MKMVLTAIFASALAIAAPAAHAASATFSVTFGVASTAITCNLPTAPFPVPAAAGTIICDPITVAPAGWSGSFNLTGADNGTFAITNDAQGNPQLVLSAPVTTPGTKTVTINSFP